MLRESEKDREGGRQAESEEGTPKKEELTSENLKMQDTHKLVKGFSN